MQIVF